jgi:hypothetical protein
MVHFQARVYSDPFSLFGFVACRLLPMLMLFGIAGCLANKPTGVHAAQPVPGLFGYPSSQLSELLKTLGFTGEIGWIRVNSAGTRLFVLETRDGEDGAVLQISFTDKRASWVVRPARNVWFAEDGSLAAWSDNPSEYVTFANGTTKRFSPPAYNFDVDPSGRFFVVTYTKAKGTEVFSLANLTAPIYRINDLDLWSSDIFAGADHILVTDEHLHDANKPTKTVTCLDLSRDGERYVEARRFNLPGQVLYVNSELQFAKVQYVSDMAFLRYKSVFNLRTGELKRLEQGRLWVFLKEDYLNDRDLMHSLAMSARAKSN